MTLPFGIHFRLSGLSLLALCFVAAALLRMGSLTTALAEQEQEVTQVPAMATSEGSDSNTPPESLEDEPPLPAEDQEAEVSVPEIAGDRAAAEPAPEPQSFAGMTPEALLQAVRERSENLDRREKRIADQERALEVIAARVAVELAALEEQRVALSKSIAKARRSVEEGNEHLIKIYQNMKPKKAAAIFDEMNPHVAASFLRRMKGEAASFVLANMDSKKAYAVTLLMSGRDLKELEP